MPPARSVSFVHDAVVATAVVVGLSALANGVQSSPLQIPGYLLVLGFDVLEMAFGPAGAHYEVLFAGYLLGLGLVGATVAAAVRTRARDIDISGWRLGAAGALAVLGVLSLLFALSVLVQTAQWEPVHITSAFGLVTLALSGWLAGLLGSGIAEISERG